MSLISGMINNIVDNIYSVRKDKYNDIIKTVVYSNVKCRFRKSTRRSLTTDSDKLIYNAKMYILPSYTLQEDYIVEKDGEMYTVARIQEKRGLSGNLDFYEVYLK